MRVIFFLFLSLPVFAGECSLYELKGEVLKRGFDVSLAVNKGTNSERDFIFSRKINLEMAPYLDRTVEGRFITSKLSIVKIEEVKLAVPDPLYRANEMARQKSIPCPK